MTLEELRFTEEEIDHAVGELAHLQIAQDGVSSVTADHIRAVLRAVRAVPARCLNGHLAGEPAHVGTTVRGTGLAGAWVQGTVLESYPVTTIVRAPDGRTDYLWTNTIRSWDPSTDALADQLGVGSVVLDPSVPPGQAQITISADQLETIEVTGPVTDPKVEGMHPIGIDTLTGGIVFALNPALVADDDGMPCEEDR